MIFIALIVLNFTTPQSLGTSRPFACVYICHFVVDFFYRHTRSHIVKLCVYSVIILFEFFVCGTFEVNRFSRQRFPTFTGRDLFNLFSKYFFISSIFSIICLSSRFYFLCSFSFHCTFVPSPLSSCSSHVCV